MSANDPADQFREVVEASLIVRRVARIAILLLAASLGFWRGPMWAIGALVGGVLIEINLHLFISTVRQARPGPLRVPIWLTIIKFNLAFLATLAACVLVVKFRLGDPLAFLLGLMVFLPSVLAGMFSYGRLREKSAEARERAASIGPATSPGSGPSQSSGDFQSHAASSDSGASASLPLEKDAAPGLSSSSKGNVGPPEAS